MYLAGTANPARRPVGREDATAVVLLNRHAVKLLSPCFGLRSGISTASHAHQLHSS